MSKRVNNQEKNKTELIATKVTLESRQLLDRIADRLGLKGYSFLSLMVSSVIRYADDKHQLDPDMEQLINVFEKFTNWRNMSSIAGVGKREVLKAIYLISEEKKQNLNALMVDSPYFDRTPVTWNVQHIVDTVLKHCVPQTFKRLKSVEKELECHSTLETINTLLELHSPDPDGEYIRQLFSDCRRSDAGRDINPTKYVPHNNAHQMDLFDTNTNTKTESHE